MKKFFVFIFSMIFIVVLTSCSSYTDVEFSNKIIQPKNIDIPIRGTWKVSEMRNPLNVKNGEDYSNLKVQFSDEFVMIDDEVILKPKYKIKFIDIDDYMVSQYRINSKILDIKNGEKGEAIQINSDDGGLFEFISLKNDELILNINGVFLFLKKVSDEVDEKVEKVYTNIEGPKEIINSNVGEAGVLLGLKFEDDKGNLSYRTLWIARDKEKYHKVYCGNNLVVPRRNSFWKLAIDYVEYNGVRKDRIEAYNIYSKDIKTSYINKVEACRENVDINFVGNDYICFETIKQKDDINPPQTAIKVVPIDNLSVKTGLKIGDLAGKDGEEIFNSSAKRFLESNPNIDKDEVTTSPEFFELKRKNGRWIMNERILDKNMWYEVPLNMIPPKKLLNYDDLYVSWNTVKSKEPGAEDAFSAPNNKFIIIQTKDSMVVYDIINGKIGETPNLVVPLKSGEKVIMAEWGTGIYMQGWENLFRAFSQPLE